MARRKTTKEDPLKNLLYNNTTGEFEITVNSPAEETKKKKPEKVLTEEERAEKKKRHQEKIVKKQEERLAKHIERVTNKEKNESLEHKERFYVTNAKLLEQLQIWRDSAEEIDDRKIPEEFGRMVLMIARRLSNHSNFKNYPYEVKQDMISYACFKCIQGIRNYNFNFQNAFAYFTTACYNAFISVVTSYYKHINIRKDLLKKALEKLESTKELNTSKVVNYFLKEYLGEDVGDADNAGEQ